MLRKQLMQPYQTGILSIRHIIIAGITMLCIAILMIVSRVALFADGAFFLIQILTNQTVTDVDFSRYYAHLLTQLPVIIAINLDVTNLYILSLMYSFTLAFLPLFFWFIALFFVRQEKEFWPIFILFSVIYLNCHFFFIGEYNLAYSLVAVSFSILISKREIQPAVYLLLFANAFILVRSYEALAFLGPLLFATAAFKYNKNINKRRFETILLLSCMVMYSAATATALFFILNPRDPQNLTGALSTIKQILVFKQFSISVLCLVFYYTAYYFNFSTGRKNIIFIMAWLLSSSLFLSTMNPSPSDYYNVRSLAGMIMFICLSFILCKNYINIKTNRGYKKDQQPRQLLIQATPYTLFLALALTSLTHTLNFNRFITQFEDFITKHTGYYNIKDTQINTDYAWGWTQPCISYLLRRHSSQAIITNAVEDYGEFLCPAYQAPDFSKYYYSYLMIHFSD